MKTNGKKKEVLAQDVDASQVIAMEKWVYYFKNSNLYRVRTNGTDREKISDRKISYYQCRMEPCPLVNLLTFPQNPSVMN